MTEAERRAYQQEARGAAKRLGLAVTGDAEGTLVQHALGKVREWIAIHGRPLNLSELLAQIATSFHLEIVEIHDDSDIDELHARIPPSREPVLARLAAELDDHTEALVMQRQYREDWEMPYLAAINCRGWHKYRKYFSKWHEVVHLLLDGKQLKFAFRKTSAAKKHPQERLVDKIAGALAFHPDLFDPVFARQVQSAGGLSFDMIERVREEIAPDASRESTIYACLRACSEPMYFLKARMKYKRSEEQQLTDLLSGITSDENAPQRKLRLDTSTASPVAQRSGVRLHENMEVPTDSIVAQAFRDGGARGFEQLEIWQTSKQDPIGTGPIEVEAVRYADEVWALMKPLSGANGSKRMSKHRGHRDPSSDGLQLF
jgi:hypothetical protein